MRLLSRDTFVMDAATVATFDVPSGAKEAVIAIPTRTSGTAVFAATVDNVLWYTIPYDVNNLAGSEGAATTASFRRFNVAGFSGIKVTLGAASTIDVVATFVG
jgi:hypothetical protein